MSRQAVIIAWPFAHIVKEVLKRFPPPTDIDIPVIPVMPAPCLHGKPAYVSCRLAFFAGGVTMNRNRLPCPHPAAAAFSPAPNQVSRWNCRFIPTVTMAKPLAARNTVYYEQRAKPAPCQMLSLRHKTPSAQGGWPTKGCSPVRPLTKNYGGGRVRSAVRCATFRLRHRQTHSPPLENLSEKHREAYPCSLFVLRDSNAANAEHVGYFFLRMLPATTQPIPKF